MPRTSLYIYLFICLIYVANVLQRDYKTKLMASWLSLILICMSMYEKIIGY